MTDRTTAFVCSTVASADGTPIAYHSLGAGQGVIVVGGALRASRDYFPFARGLARSCTVHVLDRRGRGGSGPQGAGYSIEKEVADVLAVRAATEATALFGHSYGGLVALETARRPGVFSDVAVYEPGVSVAGSIAVEWVPRYRELLAAGDTRGAFAAMIRQSGRSPRPIAAMPLWYLRILLPLVIGRHRWERMESLLEANLAEHEQIARLDDETVDRYSAIDARVLLLGGGNSPAPLTTELFDALERTIPIAAAEIIDGLDHFGPDEKAPGLVAERVCRALSRGREAARAVAQSVAPGDVPGSHRG
jgi:pimeloyl-ACP methyl ester carboxylesterase